MSVFIYVLCDPRTDEVRYVGKASDPYGRLIRHLSAAERGGESYCAKWIRSVIVSGLDPYMRLIAEVPERLWENYEKFFIASCREFGVRLTNLVEGGQGGAWNRGKTTPEISRRKMSLSAKGKPKSPAHRAAISAARMGHAVSEDTRRKFSELGKARPVTQKQLETLAKNAAAARGVPLSASTKEKIAQARRGTRHSQETINKIRARALKRYQKLVVDKTL